MKNRHNLPRDIPPSIKREVRIRSKHGCVICRCGIYQYEHIQPEFKDAAKHDPSAICCLCAKCHDKVTRGQLSKVAVQKAYVEIQSSSTAVIPSEFFDFHEGESKLLFGGLICDPTPQSVLRCYGVNIFTVVPGAGGDPGGIIATFSDETGTPVFKISGQEWIGPLSTHDLEIKGQRFTMRSKAGDVCLQLRHDPPGKIIVERLDMRYRDVHFLATEYDMALGRYTGHDDNLAWIHVKARIDKVFSQPVAIDVGTTCLSAVSHGGSGLISVLKSGLIFNQTGDRRRALTDDNRLLTLFDPLCCGIYWPGMGFQLARGCDYAFCATLVGVCSMRHAREQFFSLNRMNQPQIYIPSVINRETLKAEEDRVRNQSNTGNSIPAKEPFLVLPDKIALANWQLRNSQMVDQNARYIGRFVDEKPGTYGAWGAIKLIDNYSGPSCRIRKE